MPSFASYLAIAGKPVRMIQAILGHKKIQINLMYSHLILEHLDAAVEGLGF